MPLNHVTFKLLLCVNCLAFTLELFSAAAPEATRRAGTHIPDEISVLKDKLPGREEVRGSALNLDRMNIRAEVLAIKAEDAKRHAAEAEELQVLLDRAERMNITEARETLVQLVRVETGLVEDGTSDYHDAVQALINAQLTLGKCLVMHPDYLNSLFTDYAGTDQAKARSAAENAITVWQGYIADQARARAAVSAAGGAGSGAGGGASGVADQSTRGVKRRRQKNVHFNEGHDAVKIYHIPTRQELAEKNAAELQKKITAVVGEVSAGELADYAALWADEDSLLPSASGSNGGGGAEGSSTGI